MMETRGQSAGKIALLAWLAGLTDGDGSIGVHSQPNNGNGQLVPQFAITTTCELTHKHLDAVFDEIGIGRHWTLRRVSNPNWRDRWVVCIRGMKRCKPLLEMLLPYLVTKREEAELMLAFIGERLEQPMRRGYTPGQLAMIEKIHAIKHLRNGDAKPSEANTPDAVFRPTRMGPRRVMIESDLR